MRNNKAFSSLDAIMTFFSITLFVLFIYSNIKDRVNKANKSEYLNNILGYIETVKFNISSYPVDSDNSTYYIPITCVSNSDSSMWSDAYVIVVYDNGYQYYWASLDVNGNYIPLTKEEDLNIDLIEENSARGIKKKGISNSTFYVLNDSCELVK